MSSAKLIERRAGNQLRNHLLLDTKGAGLIGRQAHAELLAEIGDLALVGETEFVDVHVLVADTDDRRAIAA